MRPILKKLRGALGIALTWAVAWAVAGVALVAVIYVSADPWPDALPFWEFARSSVFRFGLYGLMSGALFSGALATIHRRRKLGELKPAWVGLWGGSAGFLISMGVTGVAFATGGIPSSEVPLGAIALATSIMFGGIGAATAVGTIMFAQKGVKEIESSDPIPATEGPRPASLS